MCDNVRHVSRILTLYARDNENNEMPLRDDKMCIAMMQRKHRVFAKIVFCRIKNISSTQFSGVEFIDQSEGCISLVNKSIDSNPISPRIANALSSYKKYFLVEDK